MKRTFWAFFPLLFLLLPAASYGQSAADIERLLDTQAITYEDAAWFTLASAQDSMPDPDAAFALAQKQGWIPAAAHSSEAITWSRLSLLVMQAFDLSGGMMYRLTGSARYAFRELRDRGFIEGRAYPNLVVSGEQFLHILDYVTAELGGTW